MSQYLDFISIDFWHIFMSMGNLIILTFILKKFLFQPVSNILKQREQEVEKIYNDAQISLTDAEKSKELYKEKLSHIKDESKEILESAVKNANYQQKQIIEDTQLKVKQMLEKAENEVRMKHEKALSDMKEEVMDMVVMLAARVVEKEIDAKAHEKIINTAIEQLCKG